MRKVITSIALLLTACLRSTSGRFALQRTCNARRQRSTLEAWFPLGGRGTGIKTLSQHEVITSIAQAHNKSAYQVLLRWHLQ